MRQMIRIRLNDPACRYMDNSETPTQVITGKGSLPVLLNKFTARLIANGEVLVSDVEITDVIRSGVKIKDIPQPGLIKYIGQTPGRTTSVADSIKKAEEKYNAFIKEQTEDPIRKPEQIGIPINK